MSEHVEVRAGVYQDSVTLMQVSQQVTARDGVEAALVAMATDLNLDLLSGMGFSPAALADSGPNDLLVAVRARDDDALEAALAGVDEALRPRARVSDDAGGFTDVPARTVGSAARRADATLALVSVPGPHAFVEAMDALRSGLHVMVFSDNVSVEHETALKAEAARRGLLVMGPDCGTAIVAGVGLGFANVVRPGPVGVVAASGTGAQQVCCLLDDAGVGISHVLGVGGRDLSAEVGGASTLTALRALDDDPATEMIVVVSKPPDGTVADRVREACSALSTPVVEAFVGSGRPDLTAASGEVAERLGGSALQPRGWLASHQAPDGSALRGLFAGGTLCQEAMVIATDRLGPIRSNIPLEPAWRLQGGLEGAGHVMVDLGDDDMTRGRPHPMIDHALRLEWLSQAAADPDTGVVLLDVVLGHAAHPDPALELAPAIARARSNAHAEGRALDVVVSLCGTRGDPQNRDGQAARLHEAGASVYLSNADAARAAVTLIAFEGGGA